jgi:molybdate transport system substrate-binding protein
VPQHPRPPLTCILPALLAVVLTVATPPARAAGGPIVAVAANLTEVATAIASAFRDEQGLEVRLSFGASGNLARQILRGAPFELLVSADEAYPRRLAQAGRTRDEGVVYAVGRLALYLSPGVPLALPPHGESETALANLLTDPRLKRVAVANPEHAPYGAAARAVLEHVGAWGALEGRLVIGESVTQAARFAATGGVQAAFLPLSLARLPALAGGRHWLVPDAWHGPLRQRAVLIAGAGEVAERFYRFLLGSRARRLLAAAGYSVPPR